LIVRGKGAADMLFADSPTTPSAFTLFAQPRPTPDREVHEISGRRSALAFTLGFPQWGSFDMEANVLFDFMGASPGSGTPGLYFSLGNVCLTNDHWRLIAGRDFHLSGPVIPVSVNWAGLQQGGAIGSPGQKEQFRVDRFLHWSDHAKTTLQIAATNPNSSFIVDEQQQLISEDDGLPNLEGRVAFTLGAPSAGPYAEVGLGGMTGRLRIVDPAVPANFSGEIWHAVVDFAVHGERMGVHGELWTGSGIGDYDAGIGQTASPQLGEFIDASGGWVQVWYRWTDRLTSYVGWGVDDPRDANLDPGFRARNEVIMGNVLWQATKHLQFGYEMRYYQTDYMAPSVSNDSLVHQIAVEVSLF
jgi:hypothetical protein